MSKIIDFKDRKLRGYLRDKLGENLFNRVMLDLPVKELTCFLRYSPESKIVYIEPDQLTQLISRGDPSLLQNINLLLGSVQEAPDEVKALLHHDDIHLRRHD